MEDKEIKRLLRAKTSQTRRRGWLCPDEIQLAAYVAQQLNSSARNPLEAHVANCDFCLSEVAFLTRSADWENSGEIPADLLSGARSLVTRKPSKAINWGWRWAATTAAVAGFALLLILIFQVRKQESVSTNNGPLVAQNDPQPLPSPQISVAPPLLALEPSQPVQKPEAKSTQAPAVRSGTAENLLPKLISPRDGAVLRPEDLEFRWERVPDALFYDVRVMSAEGDLLLVEKTEDTSLKLGSSAPLVPRTKYFVVARAHLRQGNTAKSRVVSFQLAEQ